MRSPAEYAAAESANAGAVQDDWLEDFGDPVLSDLVAEALRYNPDLYTAAARVEEARARLRAAGALLSPEVDVVGTAERSDAGPGSADNRFVAGGQVTWVLDLWGRLRANRAAAEEIAQAEGLDYLQARHALASTVAESYFALKTAQGQLTIDRQLLEAEQFTAETTRQRTEAGVASPLEEDLSVANVALAEAAIRQDLSAIQESRRALETLLGRYPAGELDVDAQLPFVPGPVAVGVPSELLERRPDVAAAARRVDAAFYNVKVAQAARLPSVTLSASAGTTFDPTELFWQIAADLFGPIFTGGELRAEVDAASAVQRQALGQFASVALNAFQEVETALGNESLLAERERELSRASERLREASRTANNRYQSGVISILDLIQVRRQDFQTRSELLSVHLQRLRQRLNLYLALGGPAATVDGGPELPSGDTPPIELELQHGRE